MNIRIHHFYDIIRDFGSGKPILPNTEYGHSYHSIGAQIKNDPDIELTLVNSADAVCEGCIYLKQDLCTDKLDKPGFTLKNAYNNYLDNRILDAMQLHVNQVTTPRALYIAAPRYIRNIQSIYTLNKPALNEVRKENVIEGLKYQNNRQGLNLPF